MPPAAKKAKKNAAPTASSGTGAVDLRDAAPSDTLPKDFKPAQARKAVDALLAHHAKVAEKREETELIARDEYVWLSINTKTGSTRKKLMPVKM
jgi:ribosome biogenesis protein UTP30